MEGQLVDLNIRAWTIGFTLFNAFILFLIMRKFLFKPVSQFIENRKASIRKEIDDAENIKRQANEFKSQYETRLSDINSEKAAIINDARKRGDEIFGKIKEDAEKERDRILKNAESEKELLVEKAKDQLKKDAVTLSIDIAQELIKKELDTESNKQMVENIIKDLSVMKV